MLETATTLGILVTDGLSEAWRTVLDDLGGERPESVEYVLMIRLGEVDADVVGFNGV